MLSSTPSNKTIFGVIRLVRITKHYDLLRKLSQTVTTSL